MTTALLLVVLAAGAQAPPPAEDPSTAASQAEAASVQPPPSAAQALDDSQRYGRLSLEDLLRLRIVTASQQDESLREAPVPVTVITRDMIRAIGARHLLDVLSTYVPGMTVVGDHNELNVAMRGVYGSSQQKILVLLDGHRLNSRAYSMASPDYGIRVDLNHVKQIEVLRGPGSSLYGNVALTAVVNIVTRSGEDLDGLVLSGGGGTYASGLDASSGQDFLAAGQSLGATYGKRFGEGHGLVLWAGWFRAEGQDVPIGRGEDFSAAPKDGFAHVNGFKGDASYDLGLRYVTGPVTVLANRRYGKLVEPFSAGGLTGEVYDPSAYRSYQGKGPGLGSRSSHLEVKYAKKPAGRLAFELTGYYDANELDGLLITNPARTNASFINWLDDALGGTAQLRVSYGSSAGGGDLLVGAQVDRMRLRDSNLPVQENGQWTRFGDSRAAPLIQPGREVIYSGFSQLRHRFNERWIANVGLRLDIKDRHRGENVTDLSPRAALVWVPTSRFDLKLSYARSFVDAPYWYRYNVLPSYQGSQDLKPEHLQSLQLTPSLTMMDGRLRNTLNVFYNDVSDFVFRNNAAGPNEARYANAGSLKSLGVEHETAWIGTNLHVHAALTFQSVLDSEAYDARGNQIYNVPRLVGNLVVDANPLGKRSERLWVNLNLRYTGQQLAPIASTFRLGADGVVAPFRDPDNTVDGYLLANLGVRLERFVLPGASLSATVYNLFDERYAQGGSTLFPYPQAGRSVMVNLSYAVGRR